MTDGTVNIKETINKWMFQATGGVVQTGPFAGMIILPEVVWEANSPSPMLLGCFEQELHAGIEDAIERLLPLDNPKIVNVGCSEGYYAIGLARRLPKATVWGVDISDASLVVAAKAAEINGVRLILGDAIEDVFAAPDLIVMDCEGAEVEYLDLEKFPALAHTIIIVEIHNWEGQPRTDELIHKRFVDSHHIDQIMEGGRNPNQFGLLAMQTSMVRWAAICEYRPCWMNWFVMRPKNVEA